MYIETQASPTVYRVTLFGAETDPEYARQIVEKYGKFGWEVVSVCPNGTPGILVDEQRRLPWSDPAGSFGPRLPPSE